MTLWEHPRYFRLAHEHSNPKVPRAFLIEAKRLSVSLEGSISSPSSIARQVVAGQCHSHKSGFAVLSRKMQDYVLEARPKPNSEKFQIFARL